MPVRTLQGLADVRGRGGAFWLAECLFGATGGTEMIGARVRWSTKMVALPSWSMPRASGRSSRPRRPVTLSTVRIAFPIDPSGSSLAVPIPALTPVSRQWKIDRPNKAIVTWLTNYATRGAPCLARCNGYEHFRPSQDSSNCSCGAGRGGGHGSGGRPHAGCE